MPSSVAQTYLSAISRARAMLSNRRETGYACLYPGRPSGLPVCFDRSWESHSMKLMTRESMLVTKGTTEGRQRRRPPRRPILEKLISDHFAPFSKFVSCTAFAYLLPTGFHYTVYETSGCGIYSQVLTKSSLHSGVAKEYRLASRYRGHFSSAFSMGIPFDYC